MMKKKKWQRFIFAVCFIGLFTACENDDYNGPEPDEVTANYSNKLANGAEANLALTYSGNELIGKSVYFKTRDAKTAEITLLDIVPGEREASLTNVALIPVAEGYTFSGDVTSSTSCSFHYTGKVEKGKLTIDLSNVQLPANLITTQRTWHTIPYTLTETTNIDPQTGLEYTDEMHGVHFHSDNKLASSYTNLLEVIGGNILGSVLRNVYFNQDGNITALYASMPQVNNFAGYLMPLPIRPESDYSLSPLNLATYYVKDHSLYVVPNIDMIIRLIQSNAAESRATSISEWEEIYRLINRWTTTGIRLNIVDDIKPEVIFEGFVIKHIGDMILYLDKDEVGILFKLLPLLKDAVQDLPMKDILIPMIDGLSTGLIDSEEFELGIVLSKSSMISEK